jgi:hypothetical protein
VLIVGIAPGVAEEFWCRGFLGRGLIGRYGVVTGVLMTSTLFGILHLWPPAYVITTGLMGIALHFTYRMSRCLWVPVLIHTLNNSLAGLLELRILDPDRLTRAMDHHTASLGVMALGLLIFAGLAMWSTRGQVVDSHGEVAATGHEGVMVPPQSSGLSVVHGVPNLAAVIFAALFCGSILFLILRA